MQKSISQLWWVVPMLERALRLLRGSVEAVSGTGRGKNYILVRIRVVDDELGIARDHTCPSAAGQCDQLSQPGHGAH